MSPQHTPQELASRAHVWFDSNLRDDGSQFYTLNDERPDWVYELVREAHGDMFPDDWRYATIRECLGFIESIEPDVFDEDSSHEFAGDCDIYTAALTAWLASHLDRVGYCDEALSDGLVEPDTTLSHRIAAGQYVERAEIYSLVSESLRKRAEVEA